METKIQFLPEKYVTSGSGITLFRINEYLIEIMDKPEIFDRKPAQVTLEPGTYYWCACGRSTNQPFCSGAHMGTGIAPVAFTIGEKKDVWLCNCKQTGNKPFCDGTHKTL